MPRPKITNMSQLTREQRYTISVMYKEGYSQKNIALAINKDASVISRELKRNRTDKGKYIFKFAQMCSDIRKERFKKCRKLTGEVRNRIDRYMTQEQWSPDQIVGYCKKKGYNMVSVARIYQYIRADKVAGGTLYKHCRHQLKHRKRPVGKHFPIKDRISIDERSSFADGTRFGDWEMDLIVGPKNKDAMLTLVERSVGYTIIKKLKHGKNSKSLAKTVVQLLLPYKRFLRTITTDNGPEFADHKTIAKRLNTKVYFAHPYSSWEKGLIEYTNKLYRQYIPKNKPFKNYTDKEIIQIQYKINRRPRKKLNYSTPLREFFIALQI